MKKLIFFSITFICIVFIGCTRNEKQTNEHEETILDAIVEAKSVETEYVLTEADFLAYKTEERFRGYDTTTTLLTNITENNVDMKNYPSPESDAIHVLNRNDIVRVIGNSGESMTDGDYTGYWLYVLIRIDGNDVTGWVFSKYINIENVEYSPIHFVDFLIRASSTPFAIFSCNIQGEDIQRRAKISEMNDYYVFVWGPYEHHFHYSNRPGIYTVHKETRELHHRTYIGAANWGGDDFALFTDDFKYFIQENGPGIGLRGITAWRLSDSEIVYSGRYYGRNVLSGNTIEVVYPCRIEDFERGRIDEELFLFGKHYFEENPITEDMLIPAGPPGSGIFFDHAPLVRVQYNLDTGEREILGGDIIMFQ